MALVEDAALLQETSPARAQSLLVLAYEELGKAVWVNDSFARAWNEGSSESLVVEPLGDSSRQHLAKFLSAYDFSGVLPMPGIWVKWEEMPLAPPDPSRIRDMGETRFETPELTQQGARRANAAKQRGFYVDIERSGVVLTPQDVDVFDLYTHRGHIAAAIATMLVVEEYRAMDARQSFDRRRYSAIMERVDKHAREQDYL